MAGNEGAPRGETTNPVVGELSEILRASLMALAEQGKIDEACTLAGQACRVLRREEPENWQVFNKLLHRLCARAKIMETSAPAPDRPPS